MIRARFAAIALPLLFAGAAFAQQYDKLMEKGEQADLRGKTTKAANRFNAAILAAQTPEERVEARLAFTDAVRGAVPNASLDSEDAARVEEAFKAALTEAKGVLAFRAHNDYAVFLLDRGDAAGAVAVFAAGEKEVSAVEPPTAARYLYNFALARVRSGKRDQALETYVRALQYDPNFDLAANAAFSIASSLEPARGAQTIATLIDTLAQGGHLTEADERLHQALQNEAWHGDAAAMQALLRSLVMVAVRSELSPEEFTSDWSPLLKHLRDELQPAAREKVEQLVLVYDGDLPLSFDADITQVFSRWTGEDERRNLARLLKDAADEKAEHRKEKAAAARYIASWRLDPEASYTPIYLAELLRTWKDDDAERLMTAFVDKLCVTCAIDPGQALWVMRLHVILGTYYEARDQWEPAGDPHSATFQYEQAHRAYDLARAGEGMEKPLYPALYAKLATAYEHTERPGDAWQQYLIAAEANTQLTQYDAAERMLERLGSIGHSSSEKEIERITAVRSAISRARAAAAISDEQLAEMVKERLHADPDVDTSRLQVNVAEGVVTVTSATLVDEETAARLRKAVLRTYGAKSIKVETAAAQQSPPN